MDHLLHVSVLNRNRQRADQLGCLVGGSRLAGDQFVESAADNSSMAKYV